MTQLQRWGFCFIAMALLFATGCSSNNAGKIEGTSWVSKAGTVEGTQLPAGAMKLEFTTDGKLKFITLIETFDGTYSLGMADYVTLKFDGETHVERVQIDGDVLTMIDSDGEKLSFDKSK